MDSLCKLLLISIGGSPAQAIKSIEFNKPENIIFFCSIDTHKTADSVLEQSRDIVKVQSSFKIIVDNAESLTDCYMAIKNELPRQLKILGVTTDQIVVDYTGGTKVMAAALVLATIDICNIYSYIGGTKRDNDERGKVVGGFEHLVSQENIWDKLAIQEFPVIDSLFNKARYSALAERLQEVSQRVDERLRRFYSLLGNICNAYHYWDDLLYKEALESFISALRQFEIYRICNNSELNDLIFAMKNNCKLLTYFKSLEPRNKTMNAEWCRLLFIDLVSNAIRRAELENKYNDAVVRLYSALEKLAKSKLLLLDPPIDNSRTYPEQIPNQLKSTFEKETLYCDEKTKRYYYKYGFQRSFEMLTYFSEEFSRKYNMRKNDLEKLTRTRNNSILIHGFDPIRKDTYEKLLAIVKDFGDITMDDIVRFPEMNSQLWGPTLLG